MVAPRILVEVLARSTSVRLLASRPRTYEGEPSLPSDRSISQLRTDLYQP